MESPLSARMVPRSARGALVLYDIRIYIMVQYSISQYIRMSDICLRRKILGLAAVDAVLG